MSNGDLNIILKVKELRKEATDYLSIVFERPRGLTYEPGNWMDIRFPVPEFPVGKTYSFVSSPTEPDIMISFRKGISKFKKALETVNPGDIMIITQHGTNGFLLNKRYQSVFIAGGIGIAPFRSMIKESIDTNSKGDITLIYLNHTENFPFKEEFDAWQKTYPYLSVHYVVTGQEGRLTKEKILQLIPHITESMNYIAGSPGMVISVEKILKEIGIRKEDIKTDSFTGY